MWNSFTKKDSVKNIYYCFWHMCKIPCRPELLLWVTESAESQQLKQLSGAAGGGGGASCQPGRRGAGGGGGGGGYLWGSWQRRAGPGSRCSLAPHRQPHRQQLLLGTLQWRRHLEAVEATSKLHGTSRD